jgi:hypothetical protein
MTQIRYRDPNGYMHNIKNPTKTDGNENVPLHDGTNIALKPTFTNTEANNYIARTLRFYRKGKWHHSLTVNNNDFSHDNFVGVITGTKSILNKFPDNVAAKFLMSKIPLFHKQLWHPRDFIMVGYAKGIYGFKHLLGISKLAFEISADEDHKKRNGKLIAKTDGKIMAILWCHTFGFHDTMDDIKKIVRTDSRILPTPRNIDVPVERDMWVWGSLENVAADMYEGNYDHPNVKLFAKLDG